MTSQSSAPRCAALVGPYLSGKTTLLEALLFKVGATTRKGSIADGNTVGDSCAEARARQMSTEVSVARFDYLGDSWNILDCPGSAELLQETRNALMAADIAVVVCDPEADRAITVAPVLQFLDDYNIPHVLFINKMDTPGARVRPTFEALSSVSARPLVLRELPIREGDNVTGFIDLVSERAFKWKEHKSSELIKLPEAETDAESEARNEMLESLADFNDDLMEELLEDVVPPTDEIYENLANDLRDDLVVPVFFGSASMDNGLTRLLKALRHEGPDVTHSRTRLGLPETGNVAQVFKTIHGGASGKMSLARVWSGSIKEGQSLNGMRIGGLSTLLGGQVTKAAQADAGDVVALGRMEDAHTGQVLTDEGAIETPTWPDTAAPQFGLAIQATKRGDEVKLSAALAKIVEEDPSLSYGHEDDTGELVLHGQGDIHLRIALDRLKNRFNLEVEGQTPRVPYKETIRKPVSQHARHKKQSGGHGEFGDVHLDIKPSARGSGFEFTDTITGGVVPKNYIPAVEAGVREYLGTGPLGFPVVDITVTLTDGQFHAVDSSDMAFRKAAQQGMREGMPKCSPVLLEPIEKVTISVPTDVTPKVQRLVSGRRGQLLGFDTKEGWAGWDVVEALMPKSETRDLIVELRSLSVGVGSFEASFDHLQELSGKEADQVVAQRKEEMAS
ncbi:MAG: elongation factor G [Magnetospiraceae bacterium]